MMNIKFFIELLIRLQIAYIFIPAGWHKLVAGQEKWLWLGNQMQNFGIYFWPVAWGLAASCAEFFGGIAMLFGLGVKIAAFFMICVMIVALRMHFLHNDPWRVWLLPFGLLCLLIFLMYTGAGRFSLDYYLAQWMNGNTMDQR
jgi:uncharacterized membrane protein YphA (DoxX/SURF4 family)